MAYGQKTFRRSGKGGWDYRVKSPYAGYAEVSWRDFELTAFRRDVTHELGPEIQRIVAMCVNEVLSEIRQFARQLSAYKETPVFSRIGDSLYIDRRKQGTSAGFAEYHFQIMSDGAPASRGADLAYLYAEEVDGWDYPPWITNSEKKYKGRVESTIPWAREVNSDYFPALGFPERTPGIDFNNERMTPFNWEDAVDWKIEGEIEERLMDLIRSRYQ